MKLGKIPKEVLWIVIVVSILTLVYSVSLLVYDGILGGVDMLVGNVQFGIMAVILAWISYEAFTLLKLKSAK